MLHSGFGDDCRDFGPPWEWLMRLIMLCLMFDEYFGFFVSCSYSTRYCAVQYCVPVDACINCTLYSWSTPTVVCVKPIPGIVHVQYCAVRYRYVIYAEYCMWLISYRTRGTTRYVTRTRKRIPRIYVLPLPGRGLYSTNLLYSMRRTGYHVMRNVAAHASSGQGQEERASKFSWKLTVLAQ